MININMGEKNKREKIDREIPSFLSVWISIENNRNVKYKII